MKNKLNQRVPVIWLLSLAIFAGVFLSCKDDYIYDNKKPPKDTVGDNIYDYMKEAGGFTNFLRLIDDLDYKEVLSKTGSKTLFAAKDDAFERFFKSNNIYNVKSYSDLSPAQKRCIMRNAMIDMSYTSEMLSNTIDESGVVVEGMALRRNSSGSFLDSISFVRDEVLFANPYWKRFSGKGLYLVDNEKTVPVVHFTQPNMTLRGITNNDFSIIFNGTPYAKNDIYVNGIPVIERDIVCQNGYIHVLKDLILPAKNMAQIIHDNGQTNLFNRLMNKFCMPVPGSEIIIDTQSKQTLSSKVYNYYNGVSADRPVITDSIYVKRYFNERNYTSDYKGNLLTNYGLLYYDPTDNGYNIDPYNKQTYMERDMGAMFVPTDQAMNEYFNSTKGSYLKDAYGTWDNIPTPILALFLKNHQKKSFINSLSHIWGEMNDESSFAMNVSSSHIVKSYQANNGVVYVTNEVYPPVDYQCVYGSVLTSSLTKVMNWGIQDKRLKFFYYLRSMENMYNLIIPTDEAFQNYRDPVSWARGGSNKEIWSFYYVPERNLVFADVYAATESGEKGALIKTLGPGDISAKLFEKDGSMSESNYKKSEQLLIHNRLRDIIDMHIVVGQKNGKNMSGYVDDGKTPFELSKEGAALKITGTGDNVIMTGGGDMEQNVAPASIVKNPSCLGRYDSDNGRTYFINKILHDPIKSVYMLMGEHPRCKAFFDLLKGNDKVFSFFQKDKEIVPIFSLKQMKDASGLGMVVNSFSNFRYTVFVPTEDALNQAFAKNDSLRTWEQIAQEENYDIKKKYTLYLLNFLKNHFMDNSIYINGNSLLAKENIYETASPVYGGKFHKLRVSSSGNDLVVESIKQEKKNENGKEEDVYTAIVRANVITGDGGLYNLMGRDYIVDKEDYTKAENIISSSRSVIHMIDKALQFK